MASGQDPGLLQEEGPPAVRRGIQAAVGMGGDRRIRSGPSVANRATVVRTRLARVRLSVLWIASHSRNASGAGRRSWSKVASMRSQETTPETVHLALRAARYGSLRRESRGQRGAERPRMASRGVHAGDRDL